MRKLSRREEDYLRAILEVNKEKGYVRIKELAQALEVKPPSASEMVAKLSQKGFLRYRKKAFIGLSEEGERIARNVKQRHGAIVKLLRLAGVPEEAAQRDAHRIEHTISLDTLEAVKKYVES